MRTIYGGSVRCRPRRDKPCGCVFRNIFRICLRAYIALESTGGQCANSSGMWRRMSLIGCAAAVSRQGSYYLKASDYQCDFHMVSMRHLENDQERKLFTLYFLERRGLQDCLRALDMDDGAFYHAVYRLEMRLGRAYREVQPYPLFPLDEYFGHPI